MEAKKSFGEFILQKRKDAGLTQKSFAEKLFVTESAVSKWERGISYPDITLIRDICEVLQISEHELLTGSEDLETRNTEKLAGKYVKLVSRYKYTLLVIYGIALLTCFICNIAVQHTLSWFFIVLTAEAVAFSLTLFPILVAENRGLMTLGAFFVSLVLLLMTCCIYTQGDWFFLAFISILFSMTIIFLPIILNSIWLPEFLVSKKALLYFALDTILLFVLLSICNIYTNGGWFLKIALPITLFSLIVPWGMMLIIRYCRVNGLIKTSGCLAVSSVFVYFIQHIIDRIFGNEVHMVGFQYNFRDWSDTYISVNIYMIVFYLLLGMTVVFAIAGIIKAVHKDSKIKN